MMTQIESLNFHMFNIFYQEYPQAMLVAHLLMSYCHLIEAKIFEWFQSCFTTLVDAHLVRCTTNSHCRLLFSSFPNGIEAAEQDTGQ